MERAAAGKPMEHIASAQHVRAHDQVPGGALRDLVEGLARGATAAPGTSYRLEAAVADVFETK